MIYTVTVNILNKEINIKNIEAKNEFEAENKAKDLINRKIKFTAKKEPDIMEFLKDTFGMTK